MTILSRLIGAIWDPSTGLYKVGERYYDPSIGRFTQLDPLGGGGYRYSHDDPINYSDPGGLFALAAAGVLTLAIPGIGEAELIAAAGVLIIGGMVYACYRICPAIHHALSEREGDGGKIKVGEILKGKKGSIKHAPLPKGSPSWEEIEELTWDQVVEGARENRPGFRALKKLLGDRRFDK